MISGIHVNTQQHAGNAESTKTSQYTYSHSSPAIHAKTLQDAVTELEEEDEEEEKEIERTIISATFATSTRICKQCIHKTIGPTG